MLKKFFKQFKHGQKGFTLIELLVVVAILGVLAAVAIPNVSKFIGKGNVEAANTELATVQTACAAYQSDNNGVIPANPAAIAPYIQSGIKGAYTLASDGNGGVTVTGTRYPSAGTETASWTGGKWGPYVAP
jgi:type IV pilus assembly protein PilA